MNSFGKVRVHVKSRKVPAGMVQLHQTTYLLSGIPITTRTVHKVLYDYVLGEDHQRAIEEARRLAGSLCLDLEVIDSGKQGFFSRMLSTLGRGGGEGPSIEVTPHALTAAADFSPVLPRR